MNYSRQNFIDGQTVYASHLNHIEDGIVQLASEVGTSNGGSTGGTVSLTIGTVTSGSAASASIVNNQLNLVLPKGDTGAKGPKGDTGPAGPGISDTAKRYILALFENAAYKSDTMQATYNALKAEWETGSSTPVTPSDTLPTPLYKLAAQKTFVPANKECIDTGIKPFATIDADMNLTVYATFTVADNAVNTVTVLLDCFSDLTNDQRGIMAATWTNGTVGMNMFTYGSHFVKVESGKKLKFLLQIKGTQFRFLSYGSLTDWKNIPNYSANKTVDHSLILGASWTASSGETTDGKARFFNGTVYDFQVFDTALTDAQITTLMEVN